MKNKKGFTLVELLAVVVILALIMGIAVVSVGSVISSSKEKAFRETAASVLSGVKQRLFIQSADTGKYTFKSSILEKGGVSSPYGGTIKYISACSETYPALSGDADICKINSGYTDCASATTSYVYYSSGEYKICLKDSDGYYVDANENDLVAQKNPAPIVSPAS